MSDIDREVAEKVMGFEWDDAPRGFNPAWKVWPDGVRDSDWSPSTRIADAWEVVEHIGRRVDILRIGQSVGWWSCEFATGDEECLGYAEAETAPLAICKAALEAVKQ